MDAEKSSNSSFEDLSNLQVKERELLGDVNDKESQLDSDMNISPNDEQTENKESDDVSSHTISVDENEVCDVLGNGQLVKRMIKKSEVQRRPLRGELATISFTGCLADGTVVEKVEDFQIHVGDYEVVQGLDMIIPLMSVGELAEVIVDARFAYSSLGLKNEENPEKSIPPEARITYEIHLIDSSFEDYVDIKSYEMRKKYGIRKKERANFWYNRNEYNIAIQLYQRALDYLDNRHSDDDMFTKEDLKLSNAELQSLLDERLIVYNNMAMAQIKISAYEAALQSVDHVLRCQPNNAKALYRKGRSMDGKGNTKSAINLLQKAAILEPENKVIRQDLARLLIKARREEHNEKEMYQKMLGQAKKLEQKFKLNHKQQSSDNTKMKLLGYLMGSILIGVAGVAIYRYKY